MRDIRACIVCGSERCDELYPSTYAGGPDGASPFFLATRSQTAHGRIVRCGECGFVFTSPQFEAAAYDRIYRGVTRDAASNHMLELAERARGTRLARLFARHFRPDSSVFDFGCGSGGFLDALGPRRKVGFEAAPREAHDRSTATIHSGDFLSAVDHGALAGETFDAISAIDVLEHLPDLSTHMRALTGLANRGGALLVTVPNVESAVARIMGRRWGLFLLEHLWYFSPATLQAYVEGFGWTLEDTGSLPYDVPASHLVRRLAQMMGLDVAGSTRRLDDVIVPVPVGLLFAVFRKT